MSAIGPQAQRPPGSSNRVHVFSKPIHVESQLALAVPRSRCQGVEALTDPGWECSIRIMYVGRRHPVREFVPNRIFTAVPTPL